MPSDPTPPPSMPSPCVRVCEIVDGLCQGCWRTLDEISQWRQMKPERRLQLMEYELPLRAKQKALGG